MAGIEEEMKGQFYERLVRSLTNQTPDEAQIVAIEDVRLIGKRMAAIIAEVCPAGREKSLAGTHLEETVMWAVKAIILQGVAE